MTTEPGPAPPSLRGSSMGLRFAIAFLSGAALVVSAGGGALYAYGQQYSGKVLPGVRIGNTDLSGLTPDAAASALESAYGSLGTGRVLLTGPDGDLTIDYAEIGRGPDTAAMLDAALAAGRLGEPVADLIGAPQTAIRGVTLGAAVTYDPDRFAAAVDAVALAIDRSAVNATLTVEDDFSYSTTPSVVGRIVDRAALAGAIDAQIRRLDAPAEVRLPIPFTTDTPPIETADVEAAVAAANRMAVDLVLTRGENAWTIPGASLRRLMSFAATGDGSVVPVVDEAGIDPLLTQIAKDVDQAPTSATFTLSGSRVIVGGKSADGRSLNTSATRDLVLDALVARQSGAPELLLEPVVATTLPGLTTEEAEAVAPKMREISRWRTYFQIGEKNGFGANIWIPTSIINGYVVGPGETFDFWKAVGSVTREKGYRPGGAIINGKTEPQGALAGGICSTSTTLFNAALRAGLEMGARRNHYYYIDRYPLGLDATVFISSGGYRQTMSFTNDTEYPVLIRGINTRSGSSGWVTFVLYSVPTGRTVEISEPVVENRSAATDTRENTSSLPQGTTRRVEYPVDGMQVWRTVTVYEDGKVLRRKTYYTRYATITGILLVGTGAPTGGGDATPAPQPTPAPPATP